MHEAIEYMMRRDWFTLMMVASGDADTSILGYTHRYTEALNPVRQIFTTNSNTTLAAMEIVTTKRGPDVLRRHGRQPESDRRRPGQHRTDGCPRPSAILVSNR